MAEPTACPRLARMLTPARVSTQVARYNPPWTPPPFRKNELMLPVDDARARKVCAMLHASERK